MSKMEGPCYCKECPACLEKLKSINDTLRERKMAYFSSLDKHFTELRQKLVERSDHLKRNIESMYEIFLKDLENNQKQLKEKIDKIKIEESTLTTSKELNIKHEQIDLITNEMLNFKFEINDTDSIPNDDTFGFLKYTGDNQHLVTYFSSENYINIRNWRNNSLVGSLHGVKYSFCLKSYQNNSLITTNKKIKIWDLRNGERVKNLDGHTDAVNCILFIDNNRLATGSNDTTIKIYCLETNQCIKTLLGHRGILKLKFFYKNLNFISLNKSILKIST